jgi:acyl carrier protein
MDITNKTNRTVNMHREITQDIISYFKTDILNDDTAEIGERDQIISQGLIDSMGIIRLMTHLQKLYDIQDFDNRDLTLDNFRTIERIAAMLTKYRKEAV